MVRLAAAQFELGKDTDRVLAQILSLIDAAAAEGAELVHFQECCNFPTSYSSREEAWEKAITIPGPLFDAIAARARKNRIFVSFNAAVRGEFPVAYMQNHLVDPQGDLICANRKQVLMWIERRAFYPSQSEGAVVDTPLGRIGLLSCMDGLVPETARVLACKGADIILNSLCSNGLDEAHTHIPARAAENGVFIVSANRIGDMVKGDDLERLKEESGMDRETLKGAGESQIVAPDGSILARASRSSFGLVFADADVGRVDRARKMSARRPECYGLLAEPNASLERFFAGRPEAGVVTVSTIVVDCESGVEVAIGRAVESVAAAPRGLIVLPELFAWSRPALRRDPHLVLGQADAAMKRLAQAARASGSYIVAGLPGPASGGIANRAVLFFPSGATESYLQVHRDSEWAWAPAGEDFPVFDLPFGRVGLLVGEDILYPEAARVLARKGVDLIAHPTTWRNAYELDLLAVERSAENHVAIASVGRSDSPVKAGGLILSTPQTYRFPETGEVNMPERHQSQTDMLSATLDLAPNRDKRLMGTTDLIMDVQPALYSSLVRPTTEAFA